MKMKDLQFRGLPKILYLSWYQCLISVTEKRAGLGAGGFGNTIMK